MKVFIPLTDEMLEAMDGSEPPVPYQVGLRLQPQEAARREQELRITCLADELPGDRQVAAPVSQQGQH